MIKLKIDNKDIVGVEGMTVLDVARSAGYHIPTLCYKQGLPHYSSCMVCMVKDIGTDSFIPSCTALAQDGMDINISDGDVIELRQKAIELLLSEYRAECDAPCRIVCPAGYNIPLMNRLLSTEDYEKAIELSLSQIKTPEIACINCPGYCENACRRKKVDIPVSIKNIQLFISKKLIKDDTLSQAEYVSRPINSLKSPEKKTVRRDKRFASHIGRIEPSELLEWVKECKTEITRFREITDYKAASCESESCMHCDCRAADNCRLRELAEELNVKDPRGKLVNAPIVKKINHKTGLIFENAKCIKCGLCVRHCEVSADEPALCFINRGFISIISEPLTEKFDNILSTKSNEVIEICPTGALGRMK